MKELQDRDHNLSEEDIIEEDGLEENASEDNLLEEDAPEEDFSEEDAPEEDVLGADVSEEGLSEKNIAGETAIRETDSMKSGDAGTADVDSGAGSADIDANADTADKDVAYDTAEIMENVPEDTDSDYKAEDAAEEDLDWEEEIARLREEDRARQEQKKQKEAKQNRTSRKKRKPAADRKGEKRKDNVQKDTVRKDPGTEDAKRKATITSVSEYKKRRNRKRIRRMITGLAVAAFAAALVVIVHYMVTHRSYNSYRVVEETEDNTSLGQYIAAGDNILRYSGDGVTLFNSRYEELWDVPQTMNSPQAAVSGEMCAVFDKNQTTVSVFDADGEVSTIETGLSIQKVRISSQGVVAAVLADGDTTWIRIYDKTGDEIVTMKTSMENDGYPVDLSLSEDGLLLGVSYLRVDDNRMVTHVIFYQFGNTGQIQADNQVAEFTYDDTLVPQIAYVNDTMAIAVRDDGFSVYEGSQTPTETASVSVESEILAVFCDEDGVGLLFAGEDGEHPYRMEYYRTSGSLRWSEDIDVAFDKAAVSDGEILLYSEDEFAVYAQNGTCRFAGDVEENRLQTLMKIGNNRYMMITDAGAQTIRLK